MTRGCLSGAPRFLLDANFLPSVNLVGVSDPGQLLDRRYCRAVLSGDAGKSVTPAHGVVGRRRFLRGQLGVDRLLHRVIVVSGFGQTIFPVLARPPLAGDDFIRQRGHRLLGRFRGLCGCGRPGLRRILGPGVPVAVKNVPDAKWYTPTSLPALKAACTKPSQ